MDRAEFRKFLRELPIAIALLIMSALYLVAASATFSDQLTSEHLRQFFAMME